LKPRTVNYVTVNYVTVNYVTQDTSIAEPGGRFNRPRAGFHGYGERPAVESFCGILEDY